MAGDSAQFVIDVAAKLDGGDGTIAQLDAITAQLTGAGKGADVFKDAIAKVSAQLAGAKDASAAANEALANGTEKYRELERAALQTSKAAERAALKNEGVIPDDFAAKLSAANLALAKQTNELHGLEKAAAAAEATEAHLAKQLGNVRTVSAHVDKRFAENAERTSKLRGALGNLGGPLGSLGNKLGAPIQGFRDLSSVVGESRAAMIVAGVGAVAMVAAIVAVGVAVVAATAKIAAWAVGFADASQQAKLTHDALVALHPEIANVDGAYAELTKTTGLSTVQLDGIEKSLKSAKVSAADMPAALHAAALAEAALGQGGASDFIERMKASQVAVGDFAADTDAKLSGIVAKKMRGLEAQGAKFQRNISAVFGGLNIEPALDGLERLVGLFDETSASGQTIKFLFETVFQPLIDGADAASVQIEAFALGFEIGLVKLYIALKPTIQQLKDLFGIDDSTSADSLLTLKNAGELAAAGIALAIKPALDLIDAITGVGQAVFFVDDTFANISAKLRALDFSAIGKAMIDGLVSGITASGHAVVEAVVAPAREAISAAKHALGIASPSKVFAAIGENTAAGFAKGVDAGSPDATAAVSDMVSVPVSAPTPVTVSAPAASAPASLAGAVFNFYGVKDAEHAKELISEALTKILEGDAATLAGATT